MNGLRWLLVSVGLSIGCGDLSTNPCQEYVDYVCACHADNPDFDCETIRAAHANAGVDLYEDCQTEHDALLQSDADLGEGCPSQVETGL